MAAPVHDALEINMFSGGERAAELENGEIRALLSNRCPEHNVAFCCGTIPIRQLMLAAFWPLPWLRLSQLSLVAARLIDR